MKKNNKTTVKDVDMLPEYGFTRKKGVRGKYYFGPKQAHTVQIEREDGSVTERYYDHLGPTITLDLDIAAHFPTSESVNKALRSLITTLPKKQVGEKKAKYTVRKKPTKSTAARK